MRLSNCPFCGCNAAALGMDHDKKTYPFYVWCKVCGVQTDYNSSAFKAIEAWNRRPEMTMIAASVGEQVTA